MRKIVLALLLALLVGGGTNAPQSRLDEEAVRIRACVLFFAVDEPAIRAALRFENGPAGREFGYETQSNLAVYGIACLPSGAGQHARFSQAWIKAVQRFVLKDEYMRKKFFRYFAWYYHRGGYGKTDGERDRNNSAYATLLYTLWLDERRELRLSRSYSGYQPLILSEEEKP
jgi:hypothetical protein